MNEMRINYTIDEMLSILRSLGATVSEQRVTKYSGEEGWTVWVWQVQTASGAWIDAEPVFRQLIETGLWRSIAASVTRLDLLELIK